MAKGGGGGGGQPQQQSSGDGSLDFVWMTAALLISAALGWYFGKKYIIPVVFKIRLFEIQCIETILHWAEFWGSKLGFAMPGNIWNKLNEWKAFINVHQYQQDAEYIPFSIISELSAGVGNYLKYPVLVQSILLAALLFFTHVGTKFRTTFSMKNLRQIQKREWPHIGPVLNKNLAQMSINDDSDLAWRMARQPLEFAKQKGLLNKTLKEGKAVVELDAVKATHVFSLPEQMGPLWGDLNRLPEHVLALFAVFAAHGNEDVDAAKKFLNKISTSNLRGKMDFSGARQLLIKHIRKSSIGRAVGMHAYVYTVMSSMLVLARTGGVLATSEFLWLRSMDRGLWYMLNTVGRRTSFVEVAGAYAHWLVEQRLRRPLKVPMVSEAVAALSSAIAEIKIEPDSI